MSSLTQMLISQLGDSGLESLGETLGANPQATKTAATAALPLLFSALARNAQTEDGASALHRAIEKDHDGSLLDGPANARRPRANSVDSLPFSTAMVTAVWRTMFWAVSESCSASNPPRRPAKNLSQLCATK